MILGDFLIDMMILSDVMCAGSRHPWNLGQPCLFRQEVLPLPPASFRCHNDEHMVDEKTRGKMNGPSRRTTCLNEALLMVFGNPQRQCVSEQDCTETNCKHHGCNDFFWMILTWQCLSDPSTQQKMYFVPRTGCPKLLSFTRVEVCIIESKGIFIIMILYLVIPLVHDNCKS